MKKPLEHLLRKLFFERFLHRIKVSDNWLVANKKINAALKNNKIKKKNKSSLERLWSDTYQLNGKCPHYERLVEAKEKVGPQCHVPTQIPIVTRSPKQKQDSEREQAP